MASSSLPSRPRWRKTIASRPFWGVAALLIAITLLHYLTPQARLLPPPMRTFLNRHAVERVIFVLPMAVATSAFRQRGGLLTLALAILIMLPRAIWISPYPADALVETVAASVVGYLVIWMIEAQAREKALHQKAVSRLSAVDAVTTIVTRSLELGQILNAALDEVLQVIGVEAGLIFSLDKRAQGLILVAYRGVSGASATELGRLGLDEVFWGEVARSGELAVVQDVSQDPLLTRSVIRREELQAIVVVPLKSKGQVQGVLAVATRQRRHFPPEEIELLTTIGNEIGVAIENARLYESVRFYAREISRAQEDERQRIARELHDETIQMLIVVSRRLEALMASESLSETTTQRLRSLQELVRDISGGVRRFVRDLRPPTLDHLGLVATIEGLTRDVGGKGGIEAELRTTGDIRRLASEEELALFRIAQEALSNVRRHSGASQVVVRLEFCPHKVRLAVEDNGRGFQAPERFDDFLSMGRLGLVGMQERARTLGGTLTVQSEPGRGAVLLVDVPVTSG